MFEKAKAAAKAGADSAERAAKQTKLKADIPDQMESHPSLLPVAQNSNPHLQVSPFSW